MSNKKLIQIIIILSIISLTICLFNAIRYNELIDYISLFSTDLLSLLGLYLLFSNSSIRRSIFGRIINICIAVLIVGIWMKIIHLSAANIVVTMAISSIGVTYSLRFIDKKNKNHLDFLKVSWVLSTCIIAILIFLHLIPKDYSLISRIIFFITLIDYCLIEYKLIKE